MEKEQHTIYLGQVHRMVDLFTNTAAVGNAVEIIGNGLIAAHALGVDVLVRGLNAYIEKGREGISDAGINNARAVSPVKDNNETAAKDTEEQSASANMKTCAVCGKKFKSERSFSVYCSAACRAMSQRKREKEGQVRRRTEKYSHVCHVCNKEFVSGSKMSLYCSRKCKNQEALRIKNERKGGLTPAKMQPQKILEEKPEIEMKESRAELAVENVVNEAANKKTEMQSKEIQKSCGQMRKNSPAGKTESGRYPADQF